MSIVSDSVIILVWFLIFVIILFLYVDVRVGKLRRELLSHYALCEKMITALVQKQRGSNYQCDLKDPYAGYVDGYRGSATDDIFPRVVPAPVDDEFIPTREEMAQGLQNLDAMSSFGWAPPPTTSKQINQTSIQVGSAGQQSQSQFNAFDTWEFQGGDYAPFKLPTY
jgi:hypothetical protein